MNCKKHEILSLYLLILIVSLTFCVPWASSQNVEYGPNDLFCREYSDVQEQARRLKDYEILLDMDKAKDQRIANLEKELDLVKRETDLQERISALKDREIKILQNAFEREKQITDRALKLAETAKPTSNWALGGILGGIGLILGLLAH